MTDTRTAFEAHFKLCIRQQARHKNGDYLDTDIQRIWHGWQARGEARKDTAPVACRFVDTTGDYVYSTIVYPDSELLYAAPAQDGDAQDAARYRWLCEAFGVTYFPVALERLLTGDDGVYIADGKPAIDAAIDAAMK